MNKSASAVCAVGVCEDKVSVSVRSPPYTNQKYYMSTLREKNPYIMTTLITNMLVLRLF